MSFLLPESKKIPLSKLPYGFKKRLITLAPLSIVNELNNLCPDVKRFRRIQPQAYDHVFITDDAHVYSSMSKDTYLFRIFKILHQFAIIRFLLDGFNNTNPMWETVVSVEDMKRDEQWIYAEKTLVFFCNSIDGYESVIPYICGPYTRLVLHGNIRWDQVVRLIHSGVNKIRINARIQIPEQVNDYFANYIAKHVRGINSNVLIYITELLTPELINKLREASERHEKLFGGDTSKVGIQDSGHIPCHLAVTLFFMVFTALTTSFIIHCFVIVLYGASCYAIIYVPLFFVCSGIYLSILFGLIGPTDKIAC